MTIDPKQIESLLAEKKYDEVKKIIAQAAAEKMTDKEKGAALVGIASMYMDLSNSISLEYRDALAQAIVSLKAVNKAEADMGDKIKIAEVRKGLGMK